MELHRYRVTGIVQGVGFRPFIHKLASKHGLNGWVLNDSDGVLIEIEGERTSLDNFVFDVTDCHPPAARIDTVSRVFAKDAPRSYESFEIKESVRLDETRTLVAPDAFVCTDCVRELFDPADRRHRYPFINCTNCGPRYSIIEGMPYDRVKTTMKQFVMCPQCEREYHDIGDRRYHAQPNACPRCGPQLELRDRAGTLVEVPDIVEFAQEALLSGKIFAIKSIGGFHLAVNALDDTAIRMLRSRKKRDSKPFAIMVKDAEIAGRYVHLCAKEAELLESIQRPVVILKKRPGALPSSIAPNNPNFGVMLPSAPLHHLLLENERLPALIMTSGNVSGQPIVYSNEDALDQLDQIVDFFILNDRDIHIRVDDSIVRYTAHSSLERPITSHIRRARGFAPMPIKIHKSIRPVLAFGSELKVTVALSKREEIFVSQHIGDVKNDKIFSSLLNCAEHLQKLLTIKPEILACDVHPGFRTTAVSNGQTDRPVYRVQHHHAHMASCMAENGLETTVIGIIFDGAGYGLDGTFWGGEVLVGDYADFERVGCLRPFFLLGGDKAVREPVRLAIDLLYRTYGNAFLDLDLPFLRRMQEQEKTVFARMSERKINAFETTSMGRLFDGISALLNVCAKTEYEAQAAIELESLLERNVAEAEPFRYRIAEENGRFEIDYRPMIEEIVENIGQSTAHMSRRFHATIVSAIAAACCRINNQRKINDVVLSGGVFMNEYLLVNSLRTLRKLGFNVYHHKHVPTNDGGISLGQIMVADARSRA